MSPEKSKSYRIMISFFLSLAVSVIAGALILLALWYIANHWFWAYPIYACEKATCVGASPLGYIIEAVMERQPQFPWWSVKGLRGRTIGTWQVAWEFPLQAERVYCHSVQGVSDDGRVMAIVAVINGQPFEARCLFLDVRSGSLLWDWPGQGTRKTVIGVVFTEPEVAYATVGDLDRDSPSETCIYQLNLQTKDATVCARGDKLGFNQCRLRLVGYSKISKQLILAAEEGQELGIYAVDLENREKIRLLVRLDKFLLDPTLAYSFAASSEGSALGFATGAQIAFLSGPPEFSELAKFKFRGLTPTLSCSHDGRYLAVDRFCGAGLPVEIQVFSFNGLVGKFRDSKQQGLAVVHWLPDSKHLAVSGYNSGSYSIWRVRIPNR